jgi:hypothetical protein
MVYRFEYFGDFQERVSINVSLLPADNGWLMPHAFLHKKDRRE